MRRHARTGEGGQLPRPVSPTGVRERWAALRELASVNHRMARVGSDNPYCNLYESTHKLVVGQSECLGGGMAYARSVAVACIAAILTSGCAQVDVRRVTSRYQPGIRYWRPAPYIALTPATGATTCEAKLVMLPDKSEEYAINMSSGLWGSASAKPTLQDGWNLTALDASADSKTSDTLNAFAAVLKALPPEVLTANLKIKKASKTHGCAGLYAVDFGPDQHVSGFHEVEGFALATDSPPKQKTCPKGEPPPCAE